MLRIIRRPFFDDPTKTLEKEARSGNADMKRRNIWGLNSIKKFLRLSTDPGKGSRCAVSDTSTLHSEDGEPVNNTDLVNMDNTTFSKKPLLLDPSTKVLNQPLPNPPALLPTPVGKKVTSNSMQRGLLPTPETEASQFSNNRTSSVIHSYSEINNLPSSPMHKNIASDGYNRPSNTSEELMQISVAGTAPQLQNYVDTNAVVNKQQLSPLKSSLPKLTYQQLSDDWKKNKKDILDQDLHKNTDDNSACELDISPPKPTTSRYCRNLDEFLLSDSENHQPVILSDTDVAQELTVSSQPEVCIPQSIDTASASDSNNTESNKLTDVRKNTRIPGPVIDRKKYQIGRGFDDILKIASQNVKRQRRHSLHSSESQKHDGSSSHRARHCSNGTPKKKKLHESPRKLPILVDRSLSESPVKNNHLFIAQAIQKQLDKRSMMICVPKLDVPETVPIAVTEELAVKSFCSCVRKKTERKSLFQSFSNSQHNQPITKIPEDFSLGIAERNINDGNRDESSANDNICKVSEGVDVESGSQTSMNCHLDKNRDNIGLFDRLRSSVPEISPSKNPPVEKVAASSSKDNQPIKTPLKKAINFNLLKEKLSKKTIIRALEKHGVNGSSTTTSSKLHTLALPQSEDEDMMQVSTSDDSHIANNDTDIGDFDDIACEFQSDSHDDGKEGPEHLSNREVLPNDAASNQTRPTIMDEANDDDLSTELISSDDDDLPEPSIYLGHTVNRREQPQDTKDNEVSSQDSLDDSALDNSINKFETQPPERKCFKLTLDKMVQNKQDNDLKDVELAKITKELQKDMGIDWMDRAKSEDNANNILPDHKKELDKFAYPTDHVPGIYPGDNVFNLDHIGEVFSFPSTLRLVDCGFRPVKGKATDSLLWKASPDDLVGLINSCLLAEAHLVRPCQDALMVWIFYLMSIHGSIHTIMQAFKTLWSLMNNSIRFNQSRVWLPTLKQITRVLLNYGATFESLFPSPDLEPAFSLNDVLNESGKDKENMVEEETESTPKNQSWTSQKQFPVDALNHVIKLVTHGMHLRNMHKQPVFYSEEELKQLIGLVCRAGLETQGKEDTHGEDFALCTSALLEGFSVTSWSMKCKELCEALPALTNHHHNLVHLVELFPTFTDRGRQTRRLLSYHALHKLLSEENTTDRVKIEKDSLSSDELKVCHLFPLIRSLRPKSDTVYYQLHSMIMLLDMCIGNEPLPSQEKKDIGFLIRDLRSLSSYIRVSPYYPSRSKVKHILERISIKLTLMADNMVSRQCDMSKFVGPNDTPVEHLIDSKDDCGSDVESVDEEELMEVTDSRHASVSSDDSLPLVNNNSNDEEIL